MSEEFKKKGSSSCIVSEGNGDVKIRDSDTCKWADRTAEGLARFAGESQSEKKDIYRNMMNKLTED